MGKTMGTEMTKAITTYMRNVRTSRLCIWAFVEPNTLRTAISFCLCSMKYVDIAIKPSIEMNIATRAKRETMRDVRICASNANCT